MRRHRMRRRRTRPHPSQHPGRLGLKSEAVVASRSALPARATASPRKPGQARGFRSASGSPPAFQGSRSARISGSRPRMTAAPRRPTATAFGVVIALLVTLAWPAWRSAPGGERSRRLGPGKPAARGPADATRFPLHPPALATECLGRPRRRLPRRPSPGAAAAGSRRAR